MSTEWRNWPCMAPFVDGRPMPVAEGGEMRPHSTSTPNNLTALAHWFGVIRPQRTLETGLGCGASATLFAELHRRAGHDGVRHHMVDPLQRDLWQDCALRHLQAEGLATRCHHHASRSDQVLPQLVASGERFGLIYLDGSHLFEDVFVDCHFAHQLLETGGLLAFDDSAHPHVHKVLRFLRRNFAEAYEEHSPYPVTRPDWPAWRRALARRLGRQQLTLFRKVREIERSWMQALRGF